MPYRLGSPAVALSCLVFAGCTAQTTPAAESKSTPPPVCSSPQGSRASATSLASDFVDFGVALYGSAVATGSANAIVSPYSVSAAMTMVFAGAETQTATQLESTLHLPGDASSVAPAYATLACEDETDGAYQGQTLTLANSLWGQAGKAFLPAFLSVLSKGYGAPLQQVNFAEDSTGAMNKMNAWVSTETKGLIPDLFQPGDVSPLTKLVLVNAVYFKGTWKTGFDPSQTSNRRFTLEDGQTVSVPTMHGTTIDFASNAESGLLTCEIPYLGGGLALDILMPSGSLASFEHGLTADSLRSAIGSVGSAGPGEIYLPKFSFQSRYSLAPILSGMGMIDVFEPDVADLSGMDGQHDLSVDQVVQQANVEVDETGTVAAAATAVDVCGGCEAVETPPPPVVINRPFLFMIRDTNTGTVLFMGHVLDPGRS
jgi:serine protease inhibitor